MASFSRQVAKTMAAAFPFLRLTDPARIKLNKLCEIEDFNHVLRREAIRDIERSFLPFYPDHPANREHRKSWEYAQLMVGLRQLNALNPDALTLSVAAGNEYVLFWLTNFVRMVFAIDIYGDGRFVKQEAESGMLFNPDAFVPRIPFNRNRLVVQHMDALDLRYENETFDIVFSLSSIEHFGGIQKGAQALREMARVTKPGGLVMITTECCFNGKPNPHEVEMEVFTPAEIIEMIAAAPELQPVEDISFRVSGATRPLVRDIVHVNQGLKRGYFEYPHVALKVWDAHFTSISLFLRKTA